MQPIFVGDSPRSLSRTKILILDAGLGMTSRDCGALPRYSGARRTGINYINFSFTLILQTINLNFKFFQSITSAYSV